MRFLVDTNICSYAIARRQNVLERWTSYRRTDLAISAISEAELRYGVAKAGSQRLLDELEHFLQPYEILEFSTAHTATYAELRADLERRGRPISPNDMLIAAQALGSNVTLVTNNEREFRRVPGLKLENWAA